MVFWKIYKFFGDGHGLWVWNHCATSKHTKYGIRVYPNWFVHWVHNPLKVFLCTMGLWWLVNNIPPQFDIEWGQLEQNWMMTMFLSTKWVWVSLSLHIQHSYNLHNNQQPPEIMELDNCKHGQTWSSSTTNSRRWFHCWRIWHGIPHFSLNFVAKNRMSKMNGYQHRC